MKSFGKTILFLFISSRYCFAQDSLVSFSPKAFAQNKVLLLSSMDGWLFKEGNNPLWANRDINTADWKKLKPTELSAKLADKNGRVEGWFRLKFKLDKDFTIPLGLKRGGWAATDIYIDRNLLSAFGNTGINGKGFKEYNPIDKLSIPVNLEPGKEYLLAIHFVDYVSPLPPRQLKSGTSGGVRDETTGLKYFIMLTGPQYNSNMLVLPRKTLFYRSIWLSVTLLLALLFWLLAFQNPTERKTLLLIAVYSSFSALSNLTRFFLADTDISFISFRANDLLKNLSGWMIIVVTLIITAVILNFKLSRHFKTFLFTYSVLGALCIFFNFFDAFLRINTIIGFLAVAYILISSLRKLKGAQWAIAVGLLLSILFGAMSLMAQFRGTFSFGLSLLTCFYFSFPFSLLVYVSLRFREIIRDVRENARQVVQMTEEKKELEMQALRAQMNPHFIFNSLNSINRFILQNNKVQASEYLTKFSRLVRMILQNSQVSLITLEAELESLQLYLEMEALRFNYHFEYEISVQNDLDISVLMVPPLIIQPYVENAIWHGLMHKEEKGKLDIEITQEEEHLYFKISDNGVGRKQAAAQASKSVAKHKSMGLRITAHRISMMQQANVEISPVTINDLADPDGKAAGTEVIIKMPVIYD